MSLLLKYVDNKGGDFCGNININTSINPEFTSLLCLVPYKVFYINHLIDGKS